MARAICKLLTNQRWYERVYYFKGQYMNWSTFCEIKYMNRHFFILNIMYMIGLISKYWLTHPYQKYPDSPPRPEKSVLLVLVQLLI